MSQVEIGDILPYTQAIAILNQTVFGTNWTADVASDVVVYVTPPGDDANDVTQILPYPAGYSVAFIGSQQDVQVTLVTPSVAGARVTITRQTPADRENLYSNTNFTPSMLNSDFGILTLVDQQAQLVDQKIGPRYNYSSVIVNVVDTILPILGANQGWVKNSGNTAIIAYTFPGGGLAPADATYVLLTPDAALPNAIDLNSVGSGIIISDAGTNTLYVRSVTGTANVTAVTNGNGLGGDINITLVDNPLIPGTAGVGIPQGSTAQRMIPTSGISFRYNTDSGRLEFWDGVSWTQIQDSTDFSSLPTGFVTVTTGSGALNSRLFVPTANQIDITNTDGLGNPAFSLSSTLNFPGSFTAQSTTAITGIINDQTMASATTSNLSTSAALKSYIDSLVTGLNIQGSCVCASTVALTVTYANGASGVGATLTNAGVQAAISLDGVSPSVGQRVLIKNQASTFQNGIYTVTTVGSGATNWVLTRATDYDTPAEIQPGDLVVITGGTTQAQSSWLETATVTTIGTDPIVFVQFTASLPVNVASGGTGVTSFTPYGLIAGGITSTGSLQQVTIGAAGTILRSGGASSLSSFTTATYPTLAGSSGNVMTSDGTNWNSTAPAASATSVIVDDTTTNATMFPIWVTANTGSLPLKVTSTKLFYNPSTSLLTNIGALGQITNIQSSAGLKVLEFTYTASAVNYLQITNTTTGNPPQIASTGSDSTVGFNLITKGSNFQLFDATAAIAPALRFYNAAGNQYTGLKAATAQATTVTFVLPAADGATNGFVMQTDASGNLSLAQIKAAALPTGTMFNFNQGQLTTSVAPSNAAFANISGLSISITPTSASDQVLVRAVLAVSTDAVSPSFFRLARGGTGIGVGTSVSSRTACGSETFQIAAATMQPMVLEWLDTPATTSSTTYTVQCQSAGTTYINRSATDTDSAVFGRGVSTISVCEIKA